MDLSSGEEDRIRLNVPGLVQPDLSESEPSSVQELIAFTKSFYSARRPVVHDGSLVIPFVRGILGSTDPVILAVKQGGSLFAIREAPPIIAASDRGFIAVDNPDEYEVRLAYFNFRS